MKNYLGVTHDDGSRGIYWQSGKKPKKRLGDPKWPVNWGTPAMEAQTTAYIILFDVLKDAARATRLMMRFKHRVIATQRPEFGFSITEDEVRAVVADIEKIERDTAQTRTMVNQEPAPVVSERGPDIQWTKTTPLQTNIPVKK